MSHAFSTGRLLRLGTHTLRSTLMLGALLILALIAQTGCSDVHGSSVAIEAGDRESSLSISMRTDEYEFEVEGEGDIELAPDGSGVTALSEGGYLDITMDRDGATRRVRFEGNNGDIDRRFWRDGDQQTWGAAADRFVAEVMPMVFRETGINTPERVAWLLAERGHDGLLKEIDLIRSDFVQRLYTVEYAESANIPDAHFQRLMSIAEHHMGSDFELRTTLTTVYKTQKPTGDNLVALIQAGSTIGSDFEARTMLATLASALPKTPNTVAAYLDLAESIGSDFEMRQALLPLVTRPDLPDDAVRQAIDVAGRDIGSDFELRSLLSEAAPRVGRSDTLARAYLTAARSVGADFEQRQALLALAEHADLGSASWRMLLVSARDIGSDFECASLLTAIAPRLPADDAVAAAYLATLDTVGSDFEHQRAADALHVTSP